MIVYRVCLDVYANDLTGNGARIHGGRWNSPGVPALYTSASQSLAILETLTTTPPAILQQNFLLLAIEVPAKSPVRKITLKELPRNWNVYPVPVNVQKTGDKWLQSGKALLLKIPSVIVPAEFNYIINPLHPDSHKLKIIASQKLYLDKRITGQL
jgi:RES domain-containing protein